MFIVIVWWFRAAFKERDELYLGGVQGCVHNEILSGLLLVPTPDNGRSRRVGSFSGLQVSRWEDLQGWGGEGQ
jgi:hypothetical protein